MKSKPLYIIAIDPASESGIVHGTSLKSCKEEVWDFRPKKATKSRAAENKNVRFGKFYAELEELILKSQEKHQVVIVYESTSFLKHKGKIVSEIMFGLRSLILLLTWQYNTPYQCIEPVDLKQYATGRGNADKTAMILAARRYGYEGNNDNLADAYHLFAWAMDYKDRILTLS